MPKAFLSSAMSGSMPARSPSGATVAPRSPKSLAGRASAMLSLRPSLMLVVGRREGASASPGFAVEYRAAALLAGHGITLIWNIYAIGYQAERHVVGPSFDRSEVMLAVGLVLVSHAVGWGLRRHDVANGRRRTKMAPSFDDVRSYRAMPRKMCRSAGKQRDAPPGQLAAVLAEVSWLTEGNG